MFIARRLGLIMLVIFAYVEGLLLTIVSSSSNIINTDDAEQIHLRMLDNYKGLSKVNISKRSTMHFRNFSNYFQGKPTGSCKSCGLINSKTKNFLVINGEKVDPPYKYPWMVAIQRSKQTTCGGSLINEWFVLTAAHCLAEGVHEDSTIRKERVKYFKAKDISIAFLTKTYDVEPGPAVQRIIPHPGFTFLMSDHDIALVKLKRRVICNKFKNPICLPPPRLKIKPHEVFTVAGWGYYIYERQEASYELREAEVKYLPFSQCTQFSDRLKNNYYCFKGVNVQSPCKGDSGGPVFQKRGGRFIIVGVLCMGSDELCNPHEPFIYTSVPRHISWIKSVTGVRF